MGGLLNVWTMFDIFYFIWINITSENYKMYWNAARKAHAPIIYDYRFIIC